MYDFGAGDYPGLCSHIHNKLLEIKSVEGIEEIWSTIKEAILGGSHKFIPKRMCKDILPVWCNGAEIKHQMNRCLRTLRRKISAKFRQDCFAYSKQKTNSNRKSLRRE